ncbi:hypothetical protein JSY36_01000 [Bacillus sp. H-16]|uniref:hypothetical protein n=1 Tax=Alteribacter salitolerans TaxID=2912333 RepID=UPI001963246C|nr:hypothetical protein [Alteribacter salitolerans]MBM7094318.1 hypothetical protein [Alteribacter salitolerans]
MAFGITRSELNAFKEKAQRGEIAILTHYWYDERFPQYKTVTKAGCSNVETLVKWGKQYGLKREWIHYQKGLPHFDLLGENARDVLKKEGLESQLEKFKQ